MIGVRTPIGDCPPGLEPQRYTYPTIKYCVQTPTGLERDITSSELDHSSGIIWVAILQNAYSGLRKIRREYSALGFVRYGENIVKDWRMYLYTYICLGEKAGMANDSLIRRRRSKAPWYIP